MSDERKPQHVLSEGESEEQLGDYSDLFAGDELEAGPAPSTDESLDLDVGLDGEIFAEEPTLDEEETGPSVVRQQEELVLETPALEASATAAAAVIPSSAAPGASPAPSGLSRGQLIGGGALLGVSLLLSLAAVWMAMGLGSQIETLNRSVSGLQQRLLKLTRRGDLAEPSQLGEQLNSLGERVDELAVIVEGPLSHLRESNRQALQALGMRLGRLEQGQKTIPMGVAAGDNTPTTATPSAGKAEPVGVENGAAEKGGWVINLLSVTSAKSANEELARLRKMGIRADKQTVSKEGRSWYRLRVTGFDSYEGAKAYIETVEKQAGFNSAWVAKE